MELDGIKEWIKIIIWDNGRMEDVMDSVYLLMVLCKLIFYQ